MKTNGKICGLPDTGIRRVQRYWHDIIKILLAAIVLTFSFPCLALQFQYIIILTSQSGGAYQAFSNAFIAGYTGKIASTKEIRVVTLADIRSSLRQKDRDAGNTLVVTVGGDAAEKLEVIRPDIPVVHAMLPFSTYQQISSGRSDCPLKTAVYLDQPVLRQLNLAREIFPERRAYGIFLGKVSEQRYLAGHSLQLFDNESITTSLLSESKQLAWSLRQLSEGADVFIAINDPLVFNPNNAKWLLYMAYQEGIPVIGFSAPYVAAGAAASVYSSPEQMGKQTAEMLLTLHETGSKCLFQPQYPGYFKVAINKAVVESLDGRVFSEDALVKRLIERESVRP